MVRACVKLVGVKRGRVSVGQRGKRIVLDKGTTNICVDGLLFLERGRLC